MDGGFEDASGTRETGDSASVNRFEPCAGGGSAFPSADQSGESGTGSRVGKTIFDDDAQAVSEKNNCRFKRIRKRLKKKPPAEVYRLKRELLGEMERLSESGEVDLYYGDEAGVALEPNVPYGWQFQDEDVSMPSEKGSGINCFGLFTRSNNNWTAVSEKPIDAAFVVEQLERFSFL